MKIFLFLSLALNSVYSLFLFTVSFLYSSKWFFVMSVYYGLLAVVRIFIYRQIYPDKQLIRKLKMIRACGYALLALNLVVSTMMFILLYRNHYVIHHEITVISLATFTFLSLILAIIGGVKYLRKDDCVFSCAKMVSLVSASVSLVTLTNTMLVTFGEGNLALRSVVLPLLSGIIAVFIIIGAIYIIGKTTIALRSLRDEKERK